MKLNSPWISLLSATFVGILSVVCLTWGAAWPLLRMAIGVGVFITFVSHMLQLKTESDKTGVFGDAAVRKRMLTIELLCTAVAVWALVELSTS